MYQPAGNTCVKMDEAGIIPKSIPGMEMVEQQLQKMINTRDSLVSSMCEHIIFSGGKRLRPLLVLSSGLCMGKISEHLIKTAAAVELIHTASLVHDDIIDHAERRRNKPTLNAIYDNYQATLAGDYLFAEAFNILASPQLTSVLRIMVNAIQEMCDGEINEASDLFNWEVTEETYLKRIFQKTGVLIAACCESGALISGAGEEQINAMRNYGISMGYAFQIIDDVLDFTGEAQTVGKPVGHDLSQGVITLPVIRLLQLQKQDEKLKTLITEKQSTAELSEYINYLLVHTGVLQDTFKSAVEYVQSAKSSLQCIPESPYKQFLFYVADRVIARQY